MSQSELVLDPIPPQVWLVLLLATIGFGPASYVWRHVAHAVIKRDITQPPEDLSWRSNEQLYRCLAILAVLVAVGAFIFTPQAEAFARSDAFIPSVFGVVGAYALSTVVGGWRNRRIEPMIRGFSQTYDRDDQPVRYWASLGWNAILGSALFAASLGVIHDNATPRCDDSEKEEELIEALATCDALLVENVQDGKRRAHLLAARGRVHHRLGNDHRALADYSDALDLDPADSSALYNRALVYSRTGDLPRAIADFSASLALWPDNHQAYLERGTAYLNMGNFEEAIEDFTTLYEHEPDHPYALANRGIAHAWHGKGDLAERDFATVSAGDAGWPVALRGRAVLAKQRQDHVAVIDYLSQALKLDPNDLFALRMRADAYWETGQRDLARNDDDRFTELEQERFPEIMMVSENP